MSGLRNTLACLSGMALAAPASALVGPSREAPELAPYAVMVMDRDGGDASFCTASVIARNVVLTAAHCVTDIPDTQVFFRGGQGKIVLFDVASIALHPEFKPNAGRQRLISIDLALLRLAGPLPPAFKPVELTGFGRPPIGQRFRIVGFGRADEAASGTSGVLRQGIVVARGPKSPVVVWLGDPDGTGLGGCTGDSGAPVLALDRPALAAVAIRARGNNGYSCGGLTEAVLIGPQMAWIRSTLQAWGAALGMAR